MNKKKCLAGEERKPSQTWAYPVEFRLRVVKLFLEEGYSAALISGDFGISQHSIRRWVEAYRNGGVLGLKPKPRLGGRTSVTHDGIRSAADPRRTQTLFFDSHQPVNRISNPVRKQRCPPLGKASVTQPSS